jgi:hypothetical protein
MADQILSHPDTPSNSSRTGDRGTFIQTNDPLALAALILAELAQPPTAGRTIIELGRQPHPPTEPAKIEAGRP